MIVKALREVLCTDKMFWENGIMKLSESFQKIVYQNKYVFQHFYQMNLLANLMQLYNYIQLRKKIARISHYLIFQI